jgi:hypothetical protein
MKSTLAGIHGDRIAAAGKKELQKVFLKDKKSRI